MIGARALASMAIALVALGSLACEPAAAPAAPAGGGAPQVACQGLPNSVCHQAVDTVGGSSRGPIAQVVVRCSKPICTERLGEADVLIIFVDGRRETSSYGWESAPAAPAPIPVITPPPLPVEPDCRGVPFQQCIEMATSGLDGNTAAAVGKITVQCSAVCTPTSGSGETTYEFVDGRPSVTSSWNYEGGG